MSVARIAPQRYRATKEYTGSQRHAARRAARGCGAVPRGASPIPAGATASWQVPRRRRTRRSRVRVVVMVAIVVVLGFMGAGGLRSVESFIVATPLGLLLDAPASTPQSDWRRGEVPYLYQRDRAWAASSYAGGTIAENGCGPTALAMAYICLTGDTSMGPQEMASFSEREGYVSDGMTAWALMSDGARELGLESHELAPSAGKVRAALEAGHPVICSMGPGDFTSTGHFIVLAGMNDAGELLLRDPNSSSRSAAAWDMDRVLGQCKNLWELSA